VILLIGDTAFGDRGAGAPFVLLYLYTKQPADQGLCVLVFGCGAARWASNAVRSPWFLPGAPAFRRTELARPAWPSVGLERGAAMLATVFGSGHRVFSLVNALFHGYKNKDGAGLCD
jgi:hypothetical protein